MFFRIPWIMDSKKAFTLGEILIVFIIIGVIAATTIPIVVSKTRQNEYRTAAKKAFSVLNSAMQSVSLKDGMTPEDYNKNTDAENAEFIRLVKNNLRVVRDTKDSNGNPVYYTTDGLRYHVINPLTYYVDVDGDRKPTDINTQKTDWKTAKYESEYDLFGLDWKNVTLSDMFYIYFYPENGRSIILPYVQGVEDIATGKNNKP